MLRTMSGPSLAGRSPPITMRTFPATLPTAGHWPRSHSGSTYIREDKMDENKVMQATEPVMATIALIIDRMVRHNDQVQLSEEVKFFFWFKFNDYIFD